MKLLAYIDGSSHGNPGESGYGVVLREQGGTVLEEWGVYLGHATNNVAEYSALIGCIEKAAKYQADSLSVYSDSQLLVHQVNGLYRVKKEHLKKLHKKVIELLKSVHFGVEIHYINREKNKEADKLARQAVRLRAVLKDGKIYSPGQNG